MRRARWARPRLEPFEDRVVPAMITWTNPAGGGWHTPTNWDLGRVPAAGDDVVIPDVGAVGQADQTITYNAGSTTVLSVTSGENFNLAGGTLAADLVVAPSLPVTNGSVLTSLTSTETQMHRLQVEVLGTVLVDATSRIDVSGKGYVGG